jgi:hypothetical protein
MYEISGAALTIRGQDLGFRGDKDDRMKQELSHRLLQFLPAVFDRPQNNFWNRFQPEAVGTNLRLDDRDNLQPRVVYWILYVGDGDNFGS